MSKEIKISLEENLEPGTIYLIPNFIKCIHCGHEIPIGMLLDSFTMNRLVVDAGGCGKSSDLAHYSRYFGVIKNVG